MKKQKYLDKEEKQIIEIGQLAENHYATGAPNANIGITLK